MNYYVYYRIAPEQAAELRPRVDALFALIQKNFGVRGRWMRRRDDAGTYMEVYEDVKDEAGFEALLEREGAKLGRIFGIGRKVERFQCA